MKRIVCAAALLLSVSFGFAQLNDFQKANNKKIVFYTTWLQSRLNETAADAATEGELGKPFWFRAYFEDAAIPKQQDNHLDVRISCAGQSVTLDDMFLFAKANFYTSNGLLPNYEQIQLPGVSTFWKTKNIFSSNGFSPVGEFDKSTSYGCSNNAFFCESLLRFLLSKIDAQVKPGAVLEFKYELVNRTKGEWHLPGAVYETLAEGTFKMKVPAKEAALTGGLYRFAETAGMQDKALEENIKKGILAHTSEVVGEVYKVQVLSPAYKNERNGLGVVLNRWVQVRVVYKSKGTGQVFSGIANVVYNFDGATYDSNVSKVFFTCGHSFAPSFGIK